MDYTHKLPAHLGAWPCKIRPEIDDLEEGEVAVTYHATDTDGSTIVGHLVFMIEQLTRIVPAEPTTLYHVGADGHVYAMCPGRNPGTDERLFQKAAGGPVFTWDELTQVWFEQSKTQRVVPLLPVQDVQLPFVITSSDGDRVGVKGDSRNVCLELVDNWTWCEAGEAEQIAWALLAGVRQVREGGKS